VITNALEPDRVKTQVQAINGLKPVTESALYLSIAYAGEFFILIIMSLVLKGPLTQA